MGSGLGKRRVISGVPQEIRIRTNFVHFISQWSGKKKRPCSQGTAQTVGREGQAMENERSQPNSGRFIQNSDR